MKAKRKEKKEKVFKPLQVSRHLTLTGGYTSKKHVPETRMFPNLRGGGDSAHAFAKEVECVLVSHQEVWLCYITTGLHPKQRPMARVRIITDLCTRLARKGPTIKADKQMATAIRADQRMADLAFDSDDSFGEEETPTISLQPRQNSIWASHFRH